MRKRLSPVKCPRPRPESDRDLARRIIETVCRECPERRPASPQERRAQEMVQSEFERLGLKGEFHPFRFNDNLHANMVLHFGLGVLGTAVSGLLPAAGFALHALSAGSYYADISRRGYLLRRLLGFREAHNLVVTAPANGPARLRIVFVSHIDAGYTGWVFDPRITKLVEGGPALFRRPVALATKATAALAGFDALRMIFGPLTLPLRPLEWLLTVPAFLTAAVNTQILLHNTIVPGANDNLSAVAALPVLARRLVPGKPKDVELVFVVSACEEAHLGGADALAKEMEGVWDKPATVVIALDGLSNGDLHYIEAEGEVTRFTTPRWLVETAEAVAASAGIPGGMKGIEPPVGGSDNGPFLARRYEGIAFACIDPALHMPRHYHRPSDTPENLDTGQLMRSMDFVEAFAHRLVEMRSGARS